MNETIANPAQAAAAYNYDSADRLIARIKRALADPTYYAAAIIVYTEMYSPEMAEKFAAAVEAQRQYAADEAEFGSGV